jgi:aspartyl-tRNA(Asn)/glutamyl-tRNA(Gln) amidotransferase subunit B
MRSSAQARAYATELRAVLVASGASDGKMEEGSMRVDANVSVRTSSDQPFGTRCEIKNLNSVRSLGRAIDYEAERQIALIEAGDQVVQQTRHWDEDAGRTVTLRSKEDAYDYRYFLEPDLVPLVPDDEWIRAVADTMAPMPAERRSRLIDLLGGPGDVTEAQTDQVATVVDLGLDQLVTHAVASGVSSGLALARTANEAATDAEAARRLDPESYVALLTMEASGGLTATQSKTVLSELLASGGGDPADIAAARGFEAMSEDSLAAIVAEVVAAHPEEWSRFCNGDDADKKKMTGALTGMVMTASSGQADGRAVAAELQRLRG